MANNNAVVAAAAADEEAVAEDFEAQHIARAVAFLVRQFFETQASPAPCVDDDVRRRTPSAAAPEVFGAAPRPRVPLEMYVYSLARHLPSVRGVLVGGLVYFDRMLARHPKLDVGGYRGCCAVLLACVVLSMKFWIDRDGVNGRVARAAGVPTELVTKHELYLLELLQVCPCYACTIVVSPFPSFSLPPLLWRKHYSAHDDGNGASVCHGHRVWVNTHCLLEYALLSWCVTDSQGW
eukprot:TRINITY_DN1937_c0_g1_i1.p1 TRINITY_DN1937_c0_g1~~TRINITY_DN1937_c0_g1_i1.p1  ORF type:complete len:236 (+),score=51.94 TRINITY_DN1937_c0_g1_i1:86-793(+)